MLDVRRPTWACYHFHMELYHVINRGVDGRTIFMDSQDYARFVHDLYEFNDRSPALQFDRTVSYSDANVGRTTSNIRERLVDIHGWKLVANHFHLLISERIEGGLSLFLRKLSGYARYFNERHRRRGTLLQGRTKKILIKREAHFLYILHYVHLNTLDNLPGFSDWRERDKGHIRNIEMAFKHLKDDRWSSYRDYCGIPNFPSILTKTLFEDQPGEYEAALKEYLKDRVFENLDPKMLEY